MNDQPTLTPPELPNENAEKWEAAVQDTARHFAYPPTPDIAGVVRARLNPLPRRRLAHGLRLAWAALLALVVMTLAVPETRAFVLDMLRIGAVRIFLVEPTPTPTLSTPIEETPTSRPTRTPRATLPPDPTPIRSSLDLPGQTTLADAERQLGSPILWPAYPPGLGAPDRVYAQWLGGTVVTLVWLKSADSTQVELTLQILNNQVVATKYYPWEDGNDQLTEVNGRRAVWLTDVHEVFFFTPDGQVSRLVDGNVLIWEIGHLTYRLETDRSLEEATRIAESIQ